VSASREYVFDSVLIFDRPLDPHRSLLRGQILLFLVVEGYLSCVFASSLTFDILDILDKWNINKKCSTSCVRPGHFMVFLIVFSVLDKVNILMVPGHYSLSK
jgi:hypothetical protein